MYKNFLKRCFDLILSGLGIIILLPFWIILVLVLVIDDPGPVFFVQNRVGKNKKIFKILKFRTMKVSAPHDIPTHMLENPEQWITKFGAFLRKTSLDEFPQILNIFIGQMAIIGPRPALWNQEDLIVERDKYGVNNVRPGLTGWAQVNGRDELEIEEKSRLDGEYVKHISFGMDWTCFWMTVGNVLTRKGIVEGGTGVIEKQINKQKDIVNHTYEQEKEVANK